MTSHGSLSTRHHHAQFWIDRLKLEPHPEGGYYREVYRSKETIAHQSLPPRFRGDRCFSTSIFFLLMDQNFSAFHRISQDELWHFYEGDPLSVHVIHESGQYEEILLGKNPDQGELFQAVVPYHTWFASGVKGFLGFSLVGCTVAPGFDFEDFEMADRYALSNRFPQHKKIIEQYTRLIERVK